MRFYLKNKKNDKNGHKNGRGGETMKQTDVLSGVSGSTVLMTVSMMTMIIIVNITLSSSTYSSSSDLSSPKR